MEILRKTAIAISFAFMLFSAQAQSSAVVQAAFTKSYVSEQAGNYMAAISDLKSVYNVSDYTTNIRLGWLSYLAKQYTESIRYYDIAIKLKPFAIEARFGCVKPLSAIESWEKVKGHYLQILKIDPKNVTANYWLGVIYYNRKDYANAAKLFEINVNLYPLDYDSVIMLAWSRLFQGKQADAKVLFNHALVIRPGDSSALSGMKQLK
ncbi:MAG: tetratricopeptide repeat protein [Bacteroidales bacterium]|nr:tetratricopeptide repeat protein [Bacteroidales bacterium]